MVWSARGTTDSRGGSGQQLKVRSGFIYFLRGGGPVLVPVITKYSGNFSSPLYLLPSNISKLTFIICQFIPYQIDKGSLGFHDKSRLYIRALLVVEVMTRMS